MADETLFDATPYRVHRVADWSGRPRTTDPRGYVLVRFRGHRRADVRGYVYEHVLVIESALGRQLRTGESVRHLDGNPGNNDPANLEVRSRPNLTAEVACACGCGTRLTAFDSSGRLRSYVSGHNPQAAPTRDAVLTTLARSPNTCLTPTGIAAATGVDRRAIAVAASKMARLGLVERVRFGYYRLPGSSASAPPPARSRPKCEWGSGLPAHLKESLTEDFGGLCAYGCGRLAVTWDHLIPWARGGSFRWAGNAVPACYTCNVSKNDSHPGPWVAKALNASYSSVPMENVITLAVCWGGADPDDLCDPALIEYPEEVSRGG